MSVFIGGTAGAIVGSAAIGAGASVIGSSIASSGAKGAAQTQANAANRAADIQQAQYQQTQNNLAPYMTLGKGAINPLIQALGYQATSDGNNGYLFSRDTSNPLQQTFNAPTAQQAQDTPGYQFTLDQGLRSVQNSAAARGLGTSGAALKGAAGYATGLADSTYNDVYNRALNTFKTNYGSAADNANRLQGVVSNGQNAANGLGTLGAAAAGNIGNSLMGAGQAMASGQVGSANALAGGINGIGSNAMMYGLMQNNAGNNAMQNAMSQANPYTTQGANLDDINGAGSVRTGL